MTNLVKLVATNAFGTNVLVSVGTGGLETSWIYVMFVLLALIITIAVLIKKKKHRRYDT